MCRRKQGRKAKLVFSHKRRVSLLHGSENQRAEVKPIMASKRTVTFVQLRLTRRIVAMETEGRGSYSSVAFSLLL